MNLVTLSLLLVEGRGGLSRATELSIPEKQCFDYWGREKVPQKEDEENV